MCAAGRRAVAVPELRPELQAEGPPELSPGQRVRRGTAVPVPQVFQAVQAEQPPEQPPAVVRERAAAVPVRHLHEEVHAQGQHEDAPEHHTPAAGRHRRRERAQRDVLFLQRMADRRFQLNGSRCADEVSVGTRYQKLNATSCRMAVGGFWNFFWKGGRRGGIY